MDFLHDLGCGLLMFFVAFMVFDWGRIWWYARRHGVIRYARDGELHPSAVPWRWEGEYLGYKVWTWLVRVAAWAIALWHLVLGLLWFVELAFAVSVS